MCWYANHFQLIFFSSFACPGYNLHRSRRLEYQSDVYLMSDISQERCAAWGTNFFIIIKHKNEFFIFLEARFYECLKCVQAHYIAGLHINHAWTIGYFILYIK